MTRYGSSDDSGRPGEEPTESIDYRGRGPGPPGPYSPGDTPTRYAGYGAPAQAPRPEPSDPGAPAETKPGPWFRRRWVLITWTALIVLMIALVIWGIIQLTRRGPGDTTVVPGTTSSTTSATTTTTTATTTTTTTTTATTPATTAAPAHPSRQPPPPADPPEESHHHHLPPLPSVITIPPIPKAPEVPTVITLPPGL